MANKRFWLGMLVIALVFGMTVVGCDEETTPEDNVSFDPLPGTVSITGTPYVGQTLTANTGSLGGSGEISFQWNRSNSADSLSNSIANATARTYILTDADLDKYISVSVKRPSHYYGKSSDKIPVTAGPPLTGTVSITGTAKVGQTLTTETSSLGGSGTISYQWKRGDASNAVNTNIIDATGSTYLLNAEDAGKFVTVSVTRSGHGGNISATALGPVADAMVLAQVTNSIFGTNSVNGVAYNGTNQWVAVGSRGILAYSANGETWTKVDLSSGAFSPGSGTYAESINGIAYGNGKWIAVGGGGKAASSTDGTTWTAIESSYPFGTQAVNSVVYANNRWVTGGVNGIMRTSTDGTNWTNVTHPFDYSAINSIAYGNNRWIAVGASGKMATSTDGTTWTAVDVTSIFTYGTTVQTINTVAYANNQWIAAGGGGIMATSTNGTTWTAVTGNPFSNATIQTVAYGNNRWIAAGGFTLGLMPSRIAVSSDGINWASAANTTFGNDQIRGIAFGNNKWVVVGDNSKIAYANDN